jgi:hypothetical protein
MNMMRLCVFPGIIGMFEDWLRQKDIVYDQQLISANTTFNDLAGFPYTGYYSFFTNKRYRRGTV